MNKIAEKLIKKHEGRRLFPYKCTEGKLTIGYGRNLEDLGLTEEEVEFLLQNDLKRVRSEIEMNFDWYEDLSRVRQAVIQDMVFNLGILRFMGFKKMIAAIEEGDFDTAHDEMLNSRWAEQVGKRADTLAGMMRLNVYLG